MFGITDPEEMKPEERVKEVARILAQGFLRLRRNGLYPGDSKAKSERNKPLTRNISNGCDVN